MSDALTPEQEQTRERLLAAIEAAPTHVPSDEELAARRRKQEQHDVDVRWMLNQLSNPSPATARIYTPGDPADPLDGGTLVLLPPGPERDRRICAMVDTGRTPGDVAAEVHLSRERVRQILAKRDARRRQARIAAKENAERRTPGQQVDALMRNRHVLDAIAEHG